MDKVENVMVRCVDTVHWTDKFKRGHTHTHTHTHTHMWQVE